MRKPDAVFDRDFEWEELARFATDPGQGAMLGIVSGRRRQGKTLLLQELCAATGGFYFGATEATDADSLRLLAHAHAEHTGQRVPLALSSWEQAIDALLELGLSGPVPVVVDEFPYLCGPAPALPSIIQKALAPRRDLRLRSQSRLILCGSAITFMGRLLSGSAPRRRRLRRRHNDRFAGSRDHPRARPVGTGATYPVSLSNTPALGGRTSDAFDNSRILRLKQPQVSTIASNSSR